MVDQRAEPIRLALDVQQQPPQVDWQALPKDIIQHLGGSFDGRCRRPQLMRRLEEELLLFTQAVLFMRQVPNDVRHLQLAIRVHECQAHVGGEHIAIMAAAYHDACCRVTGHEQIRGLAGQLRSRIAEEALRSPIELPDAPSRVGHHYRLR